MIELFDLSPESLLLFVAAILGGSLNAVAGGGSFFTFPTLVFAGVLPVQANATSTVALWPGAWASVAAYRVELAGQKRRFLTMLGLASIAGGLLGAILLLNTPQATFTRLIPFLLLGATLLFAFGRNIMAFIGRWLPASSSPAGRTLLFLALAQFAIAIYGGYFGGGLGVLMLATLLLMGLDNIHHMNALKTLLSACINGVAVVVFIAAGVVEWEHAIVMVTGAIIGGYGGAAIARRIDQRWIRSFVVVVGLVLTGYFFLR